MGERMAVYNKITESKSACPRCVRNGRDRSGDNLHNYGEGLGSYCWSCGYTVLSDAEKEARGLAAGFVWDEDKEREVSTKEKLTREEYDTIVEQTGKRGMGTRGITDATYSFYGVRHKYDKETGQPLAQYYPVTMEYKMSGFKVRTLPKDFSSVGKTGKEADMFGQVKFQTSTSRNVVITAGEIDCLSAFQILEDYRKGRGNDYEPTPVVSSVIGESGSAKQIAKHYEWFDRFDKIIVCYDQDKAGKEAVDELVSVLPKGKMFVMELPMKDTNAMLESDKAAAWINAYFRAKPYTPDGVVGSGSLSDKMREELMTPKIPLPPFMHKLEKMMAGGIPLGRIVNLGSASGTGKSTIIDEMVYYWIFNSPHRIGIVSLESDSGQYGIKILSRHCGRKIELFETPEEALAFMNHDWVLEKERELLFMPDGTHRFHLVEDRDGGVESMKAQIMTLVVACGCKVIVLDPLQDILDGLSNEDQAVFLRWMKGLIKSHGITFININHVRKNGTGQKANSVGGEMHEEDFAGSSTIFKSGACNLLFSRDKEAEDPIVRNTTKMKASKIRWTGRTGLAGEYYYDLDTHTMWDMDEWLQAHPAAF